ncbi:hypothetical protein [Paraburkholderia bonniea]|uniref:hypothetical protein n=1 Tax=Paraburkholderia bonniea TaxID=2152891 RepID=UPI001291316E|nr:hypothetical protein [Paraburkholderia bonniea]
MSNFVNKTSSFNNQGNVVDLSLVNGTSGVEQVEAKNPVAAGHQQTIQSGQGSYNFLALKNELSLIGDLSSSFSGELSYYKNEIDERLEEGRRASGIKKKLVEPIYDKNNQVNNGIILSNNLNLETVASLRKEFCDVVDELNQSRWAGIEKTGFSVGELKNPELIAREKLVSMLQNLRFVAYQDKSHYAENVRANNQVSLGNLQSGEMRPRASAGAQNPLALCLGNQDKVLFAPEIAQSLGDLVALIDEMFGVEKTVDVEIKYGKIGCLPTNMVNLARFTKWNVDKLALWLKDERNQVDFKNQTNEEFKTLLRTLGQNFVILDNEMVDIIGDDARNILFVLDSMRNNNACLPAVEPQGDAGLTPAAFKRQFEVLLPGADKSSKSWSISEMKKDINSMLRACDDKYKMLHVVSWRQYNQYISKMVLEYLRSFMLPGYSGSHEAKISKERCLDILNMLVDSDWGSLLPELTGINKVGVFAPRGPENAIEKLFMRRFVSPENLLSIKPGFVPAAHELPLAAINRASLADQQTNLLTNIRTLRAYYWARNSFILPGIRTVKDLNSENFAGLTSHLYRLSEAGDSVATAALLISKARHFIPDGKLNVSYEEVKKYAGNAAMAQIMTGWDFSEMVYSIAHDFISVLSELKPEERERSRKIIALGQEAIDSRILDGLFTRKELYLKIIDEISEFEKSRALSGEHKDFIENMKKAFVTQLNGTLALTADIPLAPEKIKSKMELKMEMYGIVMNRFGWLMTEDGQEISSEDFANLPNL